MFCFAQVTSTFISYSYLSPGIFNIKSRSLDEKARRPVCVSDTATPVVIRNTFRVIRFPIRDFQGTSASIVRLPMISACGSDAAFIKSFSISSGRCCPSASMIPITLHSHNPLLIYFKAVFIAAPFPLFSLWWRTMHFSPSSQNSLSYILSLPSFTIIT